MKLSHLRIRQIIDRDQYNLEEVVELLSLSHEESAPLFLESACLKEKAVGNKVYLRGLIEFSNVCRKNCYYCGIRRDNRVVSRYTLSEDQILSAAQLAKEMNYASVVLQSGERIERKFISRLISVIKKIRKTLGLTITLSIGEQTEDVYSDLFKAGAERYLLRMETTHCALYAQLHPSDHSFEKRQEGLQILKKIGYQTGTGVMIGLPHQTIEDLAADLLFFREFDIHMVGMGPYLEHQQTPLYEKRGHLWSKEKRYEMTLKMIAILRLMMKDINIASTTALESVHPQGREEGIKVGANIIMPNLTPPEFRGDYLLYNNKPGLQDDPMQFKQNLEQKLTQIHHQVAYGEVGTSQRYLFLRKSVK